MTVHLDNPGWQDREHRGGPFHGTPRQVRNGVPWKPYIRGERRHWWAELTRQAIETDLAIEREGDDNGDLRAELERADTAAGPRP